MSEAVNNTVQCPRCGFYTQGNFCGQCGCAVKAEPVTSAGEDAVLPAEQPAQYREPLWIWLLLGGLVTALMLVGVILLFGKESRPITSAPGYDMLPSASQPSKAGELPNGVSQDEYNQLSLGMTYAQASAIIGGDGTILDGGENIQGEVYYIYGFPGEYNVNAVVYITISNDVITDISVDGSLE